VVRQKGRDAVASDVKRSETSRGRRISPAGKVKRKRSVLIQRSEADVAIEFMLVTYSDQRTVYVDGEQVGVTNHTLMLPGDEYKVTLEGAGYSPGSVDVVLAGTSLVRPMVVAFAAAAAPAG
jgi:hypothetical protein